MSQWDICKGGPLPFSACLRHGYPTVRPEKPCEINDFCQTHPAWISPDIPPVVWLFRLLGEKNMVYQNEKTLMKSLLRRIVLLSVGIMGVTLLAATGQEGVPFTHIVTALDSPRFFVMSEDDQGACYEAKGAGQIDLLWKTQGWFGYPEDLFLTHNGKTLVYVPKPFALTEKPPEDMEVIRFYHEGKLQRTYRVRDLIKKPQDVSAFSVSWTRYWHILEFKPRRGLVGKEQLWVWLSAEGVRSLPERPPHLIAEQFFFVETSENEQIVFSIDDGKIIFRGPKTEVANVEPDPFKDPAETEKEDKQPNKPWDATGDKPAN